MKKRNILILLGPNLNLTGTREKGIYGEETAESINRQIISKGNALDLNCTIFQTNHEGVIIDKIHDHKNVYEGGVINAGALAQYSYAIREAIAAVRIPFIEVHMTNIYAREEFRRKSVIADVCAGQIAGFGKNSYFLALQAINELI